MRRGALIVVLGLLGASACGTLVGSGDDDSTPTTTQADASLPEGSAADGTTSGADGAGSDASDAGGGGGADADADAKVALDAGCKSAASCERVIFVTAATYAANFMSLAAADARCQEAADKSTHAHVRGRTFLAWLSVNGNGSDDPNSRFVHGTQSYVLPDGTVVAAMWSNLVGNHAAAVHLDENGVVRDGQDVWTGTQNTGDYVSPNCAGWTSNQASDQAKAGSSSAMDSKWTDSTNLACSLLAHLYCVEK